MIGEVVTLWWDKSKGPGGWLIHAEDREPVAVKWVRLDNATTDVSEEGFRALPGGPRGVIRGTLMAWEPAE